MSSDFLFTDGWTMYIEDTHLASRLDTAKCDFTRTAGFARRDDQHRGGRDVANFKHPCPVQSRKIGHKISVDKAGVDECYFNTVDTELLITADAPAADCVLRSGVTVHTQSRSHSVVNVVGGGTHKNIRCTSSTYVSVAARSPVQRVDMVISILS
jgi:hypothetical protein